MVKKSEYRTLMDEMRSVILENRIIVISDSIDNYRARDCVQELLYASCISPDPIKIILNSVGGQVYPGLLIYNTIRSLINDLKIHVEIEARGLAASMGCIILQAGSTRTAALKTRFLIHEILSWDFGSVTKMEEQVEELRKLNNDLRDIIAIRSGKDPKEIDKLWTKKDVWMNTKEALEFGLIDKVLEG